MGWVPCWDDCPQATEKDLEVLRKALQIEGAPDGGAEGRFAFYQSLRKMLSELVILKLLHSSHTLSQLSALGCGFSGQTLSSLFSVHQV